MVRFNPKPLLYILFCLAFAALAAVPVRAGPAPSKLAELADGLRLAEMSEIMALEGADYGAEIEREMFLGRGGVRWADTVADIYSPDRVTDALRVEMAKMLDGPDLDLALDYLTSDIGTQMVTLELTARRAMLDKAVDDAARQRLMEMRENDDARLALLSEFIAANGLVEQNVASGLNAQFAFYRGLVQGGAFERPPPEPEILAQIWEGEPELRAETNDWLMSYLAMAYAPASDDELQAYIDFSTTPAGQRLNNALFNGFDVVFSRISLDLGLAAAQFIAVQDI